MKVYIKFHGIGIVVSDSSTKVKMVSKPNGVYFFSFSLAYLCLDTVYVNCKGEVIFLKPKNIGRCNIVFYCMILIFFIFVN